MRKFRFLLMYLVGALLFAQPAAYAQEPPPGDPRGDHKRPQMRGERGQGGGNGGPRRSGGGGPGGGMQGAPLDKYLENLKTEQPDAYAELIKLRDENPEQFRRRLMDRLYKMRANNQFSDFPEMRNAMEKMSPERRAEMMNRFNGGERGGFRGAPRDSEEMEKRRQQYEMYKRESKEFRQRYEAAQDDAEREKIRAEVVARVSSMFEARQDERRKHIERIRSEVERMESQMAEDEEQRDKHVNDRVDELLGQ